MKQLIETIVKPIVDFPEDVQVDLEEDENKVTYLLSVNKSDMGKVIGKQGRIAKSIRAVVKAATARNEKPVFVEIM